MQEPQEARAGSAGSQSGSRRFAPDGEGGGKALPLPAEARSRDADSPAAALAGPGALHSPQGVGGSGLWPQAARQRPRACPWGGGGEEVPSPGTCRVWSREEVREGREADCEIPSERGLNCKLQLKRRRGDVGGGELRSLWIRARRGSEFQFRDWKESVPNRGSLKSPFYLQEKNYPGYPGLRVSGGGCCDPTEELIGEH